MPDIKKTKKLRLYKFASEYNLSTEVLMNFLQEKGHTVKSHMSLLTDEMLADIQAKYKKEMEKAESHYRKVNEFHKKRIERKHDDPEPEDELNDIPIQPVAEENDAENSVADENTPIESEKEIEESTQNKSSEDDSSFVSADNDVSPEDSNDEEFKPEGVENIIESEDTKADSVVNDLKQESITTQADADDTISDKSEADINENEADVKIDVVEAGGINSEKKEIDPEKNTQKNADTQKVSATEKSSPTQKTVVSEERAVFKTDSELKLEKEQTGLKIIGKIDLEKNDRKKEKPKKKKTKEKSETSKKELTVKTDIPKDVAESPSKSSKKKWKKKKKDDIALSPDELTIKSKKKKKKKGKRPEIDQLAVDQAIKETMMGLDNLVTSDRALTRKKKRKEKAEQEEQLIEQQLQEEKIIKVTEYIAVSELANIMKVSVSDVIQKCMGLGLMVSINQRLDVETITLVTDEFGFEVEFQEEYAISEQEEDVENEEDLEPRSPIVTIMGHVDHGKTSLLDYIRRENVVAGEAGGITQHIGAYKVELENGKSIAFLDTPGHEAFTAMRARGASVTDIVVLIVAADDAVMPQTVEAINHAMAANVPIIVAINKIDKPGADPEKIKQQLAERNILVEDWGGKYQCAEISAKQGLNIDQLLEKILLEAEMLELKANPNRNPRGIVIESQLDKGRGVTATILIQKGTMKVGQPFVAGICHGRVRAMFDERNKKITEAGPSTPVLVLGFEGRPQAGDVVVVMDSEKEVRDLALKRQQLKREQDFRQHNLVTLDEIAAQAGKGKIKELPIIVKGDVDGSVEAIADSLMKLTNDEVTVNVIHKGVGGISESDVILAQASRAIIIGFHVRPLNNARKMAEKENIEIRLYNVIYDAISEVKAALEGLLDPIVTEKLAATVEVRDTFKVPKLGTVAGCYVQDGKLLRNNKIRLFRNGIVIYEGQLASLKRFKDDVSKVDAGYECGLNIHNFNDIKIGDVIESYELIEEKKKLEL